MNGTRQRLVAAFMGRKREAWVAQDEENMHFIDDPVQRKTRRLQGIAVDEGDGNAFEESEVGNVAEDVEGDSVGDDSAWEDNSSIPSQDGYSSGAEDVRQEQGSSSDGSVDEEEENRNYDDRLLLATYIFLKRNIPASRMQEISTLSEVLIDGQRVVNVADVKALLEEVDGTYGLRFISWCRSCEGLLRNTAAACDNEACEAYRQPIRRDDQHRWVGLTTCSLKEQLRCFVQQHLTVIRQCHAKMRDRRRHGFRGALREMFLCSRYCNNIETEDEDRNHVLRISLIINVDGYQSPGHTRCAVWPVFVAVIDVPLSVRNRNSSLLLAGLLYCASSPSQRQWQSLLRRTLLELTELREVGLQVTVEGARWMVYASVQGGSMDLAAMKSVFRLNGWQREFGCPYCSTRGTRAGPTIYWPFDGSRDWKDLFTVEEYRRNAQQGTHGFVRPPTVREPASPLLDVLLPYDVVPDALHLVLHGLGRDIVRDEIADPPTDCKRPGLRIPRRVAELLDQAFRTMRLPRSSVRARAEFRRFTASDMNLILVLECAIGALHVVHGSALDSALVFLLCYSYRLLLDVDLTELKVRLFRDICDLLRAVWVAVWGLETCTMKVHEYLQHVPTLLMSHGSPTQNSTAVFECGNRLLELDISSRNTRGVYWDAAKRFTRLHELQSRILLRRQHSSYAPLLAAADELSASPTEGENVEGFRLLQQDAVLVEDVPVYIRRVCDERQPQRKRYYRRAIIRGDVYTSSVLHTGDGACQHSLAIVERQHAKCIVNLLVFVATDHEVICCGKLLRSVPPQRKMKDRLWRTCREPYLDELSRLLDRCAEGNPYYWALLAEGSTIVTFPQQCLRGHAAAVEVNRVTYACDMNLLRVHV